MGSSIRDQIEWLFASRRDCLKEIAVVFARGHGKWISMEEIINQVGKNYPNSTIYSNFKTLSSPMKELGNHSYIIESRKNCGKRKPALKGKLSDAASERLFSLAHHAHEKPPSKILTLRGAGQVEIPALSAGTNYVPPDEMMALRERKIGKEETLRRLRNVADSKPGSELAAIQKEIERLAIQRGISFNSGDETKSGDEIPNLNFVKDGKYVDPDGDLAIAYYKWRWLLLPHKDKPYTANAKIKLSEHKIGRFPKKRIRIENIGLIDLFADEYSIPLEACLTIADSRQDAARVHALEERALKGEKEGVDELIQVLSSDNSQYARQDAAHSLGRLHDIRVTEPLIKAMLSDEYSGVRSVAATMIREFGYCNELTMALKDRAHSVRQKVATILGEIGDTRAIDPLREALKDPDIRVQCAAAGALGKIGDSGCIDSLILMLDHESASVQESASVRGAAATALGNIGNPRAIQPIRNACDDPNEYVRGAAKKALEKLEKRSS